MYLRNSDVILIVYDATKESSLYEVSSLWIPFLKAQRDAIPAHVLIYMVATKIDLCSNFEDREFIEKGRSFALGMGYQFAETSAKWGTNVTKLFDNITQTLKSNGRSACEAEREAIRLGIERANKQDSDQKERKKCCK